MVNGKKSQKDLNKVFMAIDGQLDKAYRDITGSYDYDNFTLTIDYVPDDPGRYSSRFRATMPLDIAKFPDDIFIPKSREVAARDFIARKFASMAVRYSIFEPGVKGGRISIDRPAHELLETNAVVIGNGIIEVRFTVNLPVKNGRVLSPTAVELLMKRVPGIVCDSLIFDNIDGEKLTNWIETNEDTDVLRDRLVESGLVAFIADGSILPRRTSMDSKGIVPFSAPDELAVTFDLPNRGKVRGMGIPAGITVIIGGGSHGKTTLLRAVELGVYNHIYGDGRELVVTIPDAVGIRVEEGRRIENVDISPFIANISQNIDTKHFSSGLAPPAASMAANIMESLEIGTSLLLFDDETVVTSLVGRDARMQALIPKELEPITTLVDILPLLRDEHNISSIIVGGSGDYFDIADTVIAMKYFQAFVVTDEAKQIVQESPARRIMEYTGHFSLPAGRCPFDRSLEPVKEEKVNRSRSRGKRYVQYGDEFIDVSKVTQLINQSQSRAISRGIAMVYRLMDSSKSLKEAVDRVVERVEAVGLDVLSNRLMGDLASFRAYELIAAINRKKNLKIK